MKKKILIVTAVIIALLVSVGIFIDRAYVFPVMMYHSISDDSHITKLSVSPESFEKQMKFLHDNRYNVIALEEAAVYIKKIKKVPPRTLAITFDDGFYNNYVYAYPILKKYNLPATIFVIVENIGKPGWLGFKELKEMSDSGLITIGSHTLSHSWLPSLSRDDIGKELTQSKSILEKGLGEKITLLCYPLGAYDRRCQQIARDAGYTCAAGTNPGLGSPSDDVYAVKRIKISRTSDNPIVLWFETSGLYTWFKEHRSK